MSLHSEQTLDPFSRFCTAKPRYRLTDAGNIVRNRQHLMHSMRPNNEIPRQMSVLQTNSFIPRGVLKQSVQFASNARLNCGREENKFILILRRISQPKDHKHTFQCQNSHFFGGGGSAHPLDTFQGRIQEFWKGGPVRGQSPEPSAEGASDCGGSGGLPRKF